MSQLILTLVMSMAAQQFPQTPFFFIAVQMLYKCAPIFTLIFKQLL